MDEPTSSTAKQTTKAVLTRNRKKGNLSRTQENGSNPMKYNRREILETQKQFNECEICSLRVFKLFSTEGLFQLITHKTNSYRIQRSTVVFTFAVEK